MPGVLQFFGKGSVLGIPFPVILFILVFAIYFLVLGKTTLGRRIYAVGSNDKCAGLAGISISRVKLLVYSISGLMAAVSGMILLSRLNSAQPTLGTGYELDAIASVALGGTSMNGGRGRITGTLIGILIIAVLNNGLNILGISSYYQDVDCFIGTDNVKAGEEAGKYFLDKVGEGAKIAILEGIPGASSAIDRNQGFLNAVEGKADIVASQTANYNRAEGLTVTENILQAHPDITGILAANDEMGLGATEAAEAAGKVPGKDILITGFDTGDDARQAVKDGKMLITVEQQTTRMGEMAVESALKMMQGETVEKNIPIDITLIDE